MQKGDASRFSIGDLEDEGLDEVFKRIRQNDSGLVEKASGIYEGCLERDCFEYCRGGDRLNGILLNGVSKDPYCEKINR